jgi:AcrR family transcriptional regulator
MSTAPERGRPRGFDTAVALMRAKEVFWKYGYEGASMAELTAAMGISKPSLYAAFGSKEELFKQAHRLYAEQDMAYTRDALQQPTAYEVTAALLRDNVRAVTREGTPPGCLSIQGGTACGAGNADISAYLAHSRLAGEAALAARFARAVDEHDLPAGTDPAGMARFVMIVAEGQAVHAAAGISREQLEQSTDLALRAFPQPGAEH